jgi:hypothetical protein
MFITFRNNPVVHETGDQFRDTLALTVRGDGVDIPPFFILHSYKNASYASGRRCPSSEAPIKGMNNELMIKYLDYLTQFVTDPSLLLLDRLSSHHSASVVRHLDSKVTATGEKLFTLILLPAKTSFLVSPLDNGAIAAFKAHYHKLDRSTLNLKKRAIVEAWGTVTNDALMNICLHCGITGDEPIDSLRSRFMKEVGRVIPEEKADYLDFYDCWKSGAIEVEGASRGRGVTLERPQQLRGGNLDGKYWTKFGGH